MQQKKLLNKLNQFFYLGRYHKPYGSILLMWPCYWGISYINDFSFSNLKLFIFFFIGSIVMRGAGCTINDIIDAKFDRKVKRTKYRPIANKKISNSEAYFFLLFQLFCGFLIVINFNLKTVLLSFLIIPLVILYPFFKRFSHYPQFILGLLFNWGVFIGHISMGYQVHFELFCLYLAGTFLTIGYDTIYAFQDIEDDIKIGVKSFAIKVKSNPRLNIFFIYLISFLFFSIAFLINNPSNLISYLCLVLIFLHLVFQVLKLNINDNVSLQKIFISNTVLGGIVFICLVLKNNFYL